MTGFREAYVKRQVESLKDKAEIIALWEAGSAATGTTDEYSDIDLIALCTCETSHAFALIESAMPPITHCYVEPEGRDVRHRIYFHDETPEHFYADIGVLQHTCKETFSELMVIERHGHPVVHFDHVGLLKPQHADKIQWQEKLENRVVELEEAFPIYITQVLKALDRHRYTEAFAFYYHGLLRRYVELIGIRFRPFRYDFELRYLERDFPREAQDSIHDYMKYIDPDDLRQKVGLITQDIRENLAVIEREGISLG